MKIISIIGLLLLLVSVSVAEAKDKQAPEFSEVRLEGARDSNYPNQKILVRMPMSTGDAYRRLLWIGTDSALNIGSNGNIRLNSSTIVSGTLTATSFVGDGSQLTGVGGIGSTVWTANGTTIRLGTITNSVSIGSTTTPTGIEFYVSGDTRITGTTTTADLISTTISGGTNTPQSQFYFAADSTNNFVLDGRTNQRNITQGLFRLLHTPQLSGSTPIFVDVNTNGYGDTYVLRSNYVTTNMAAGDSASPLSITVDTDSATGGNVYGLSVDKINTGSVSVTALNAREDVNVISQSSGVITAASNAFTYDGGYTNVATAFGTSGTNVSIFVSHNDYIYIGNTSVFSLIEVILATPASGAGVKPAFQYSDGVGGWTTFEPIDGTNGFRINGSIEFPNLVGWATDTVNAVSGVYWIRIQRTQAGVATTPVESTIKIQSPATYSWDKSGNLIVNNITASSIAGTITAAAGWTDDGTVVRLTTVANKVGIGTTTPAVALEVLGTTTTTGLSASSGAIANLSATNLYIPSLTNGSVLFATGTVISQDNSNLYWDDNNNRLGIGTTTPAAIVQAIGTITSTGISATSGTITNIASAAINNSGTITTTSLSTGALSLNTLSLPQTTSGTIGVVLKEAEAFIHTYGTTTATSRNTFIGFSAGTTTTTTIGNTGVGDNVMTNVSGNNNVAMGAGALRNITSGASNMAIGSRALFNASTCNANIAIGLQAGQPLTTGGGNILIGQYAGIGLQSGVSFNIGIGNSTFFNNVSSVGSIAIGASVGQQLTSGVITAVGYNAALAATTGNITAIGLQAGVANTTGTANTFLGYQAGKHITTGYGNTFIGAHSGTDTDTVKYATTLGYGAMAVNDNTMVLGGTGVTAVNVGIGTNTPPSRLYVDGEIRSKTPDGYNVSVGVAPHGEIDMGSNGTATTIASSGVYYKVSGDTTFDVDCGKYVGTSSVSNRLVYTGTATVCSHIACTVSYTAGSSDVIRFVVTKNGTTTGAKGYIRDTIPSGAGGQYDSTALHVSYELAKNDYVELWVANLTDTDAVTVSDMNMFLLGIGNGEDF